MLKANHNRFQQYILNTYLKIQFPKHFHAINVSGNYVENGKAILLIGNHISWWDGFFALRMNRTIFQKKIHVMMLEEELRKNMLLNGNGAFSISPGTRDMLESLKYAGALLNHADNLLVVYPQGKIQSVYASEIQFEKGWYHLTKYSNQDFDWVFYAAMPDYGNKPKPSLQLYIQQAQAGSFKNAEHVQHAYQQFYHQSLTQQKKLAW